MRYKGRKIRKNCIRCHHYSKKRNKIKCINYKGICLLDSVYNIDVKIKNRRLKAIAENIIEEKQMGHIRGRSTMGVFCITTAY